MPFMGFLKALKSHQLQGLFHLFIGLFFFGGGLLWELSKSGPPHVLGTRSSVSKGPLALTVSPSLTFIYHPVFKVLMCVVLTRDSPKATAGAPSHHATLSPDQRERQRGKDAGHA